MDRDQKRKIWKDKERKRKTGGESKENRKNEDRTR